MLCMNMAYFILLFHLQTSIAGSFLLAKNGVCVIKDINLCKKDIKETVQRGDSIVTTKHN